MTVLFLCNDLDFNQKGLKIKTYKKLRNTTLVTPISITFTKVYLI